jgi:D-2-hydroxyacid dehydrogenase (NADP+)
LHLGLPANSIKLAAKPKENMPMQGEDVATQAGASHEVLILNRNASLYAEALRQRFPALTIRTAGTLEEALGCCAMANIAMGLASAFSPSLIAAMPRLRWIQALTTGVDEITRNINLPAQTIITSARGIHGPQMSELAFLYMLGLVRDIRHMLANQTAAKWEPRAQRLLFQKTVVVLGVGAIAEEFARRAKAFGMRVIGISDHRDMADGFDALFRRSALVEAAAQADFLVIFIPYAADTHHIVNAEVLGALKRDAIVINLARGNVVDEQALIAALREGRIGGAGLDVFAVEPLPPDSPLWHFENVIISSRVGGMSDIYPQQILPIMIENTAHFTADAFTRMVNRVKRPADATTQGEE